MLLIRGLYEVAIPVRRLQRAETFYRDVLALAVGMVVLQEHDSEFPRYHFAFTVDESDLERAATVLRECGVPTRGPISHDWIPGTSLYFEDLDGHELELFASST